MAHLLHQSIDRSAERDPQHEAFRFQGTAIHYGEMVERSNRLARTLRDHGVEPSDRVGLYMLKGLALPVSLYGVLKAGAAYVPIDPSAPPSRVRAMIADCGIRHLVTDDSRIARALELAETTPQLECVVGPELEVRPGKARLVTWSEVETASAEDPAVSVREEDLAYIMYTSGSTGVPKGLMHTHRSGASYAVLSAATYGVTPGDRLGNHSPLHFDMSTFEYLTGPFCGATTVIIPEETTLFPVSMSELIERERLTFWYSVPLALIQLVTRGQIEHRDASSLRWVLFGGEPFPPKYLWRLMDLWPQARFSNSYGPAEVNQCTFYHVPRSAMGSNEPIPIGRVWEGAEGLILDESGEPTPPGGVGELLIRAPTMMRGYWARPDLDGQAFYLRKSADGRNERFYRTGDLVRERADGNLDFLGRKDRQIKVRGYRVELDEIESVLGAEEEVAEAAAIALPSEAGETKIVVAVTLAADRKCDVGELRRRSAERLPAYAVPERIEVISQFPRTGSGKIDRPALTDRFSAG